MKNRDSKGRFAKNNKISSLGGKARAKKLTPEQRSAIARKGFAAFKDKYFDGSTSDAMQWLIDNSLYVQDREIGNNWFYMAPKPKPLQKGYGWSDEK